MGKRISDVLHKPVDNLTWIWLFTIAMIVGVAFAAAVALLYAPK